MGRVFDSLLKNIFDNSLYLSVHERSLELIKNLVDIWFTKPPREYLSDPQINTVKRIMLLKVMNAIALKFGEIKENFSDIKRFVAKKGFSMPKKSGM